MRLGAPSPWPFLLSKLRQAHRATVTHAELAAAGLDPVDLLRARVIERVGDGRWCVPDCQHDCYPALDFDERRDEGLVGVACPEDPACWPGWRWHPLSIVELFCAPAANVFAGLRETNDLEPLAAELSSDVIPVGVLARRGRRIPVVWMLQPFQAFTEVCSGLASKLGGNGLVVLLSRPGTATTGVRLEGDIVALDLLAGADGDLGLWRALDALDPGYRDRRAADALAIFDEVVMEFAHLAGDRHVVRINGHDFGGFQKSDLKFMRLLYLAAARAADPDTDGGGWLEKFRWQGDERDHDVERVRKELEKYHHPDLSHDELKALIKTSPKRDGTIRLAVHPRHVHFDSSLATLQLVGEQQTLTKKGKRSATPGAGDLAENLRKGRLVAEKLLADARKLGVPGPADQG